MTQKHFSCTKCGILKPINNDSLCVECSYKAYAKNAKETYGQNYKVVPFSIFECFYDQAHGIVVDIPNVSEDNEVLILHSLTRKHGSIRPVTA